MKFWGNALCEVCGGPPDFPPRTEFLDGSRAGQRFLGLPGMVPKAFPAEAVSRAKNRGSTKRLCRHSDRWPRRDLGSLGQFANVEKCSMPDCYDFGFKSFNLFFSMGQSVPFAHSVFDLSYLKEFH